jgi:hypothetical protein
MAFAAASLVSSLGVGLESSAASTFAWPAYHSNTELYAEWQKLADSSYCKDKMNLVNEDESVDGWKLKTATFGTGDTKVMYVFGIHGREYLGAEVGLALMKRLCNEEGDSRIDELLKKATFKMFPLMNPSGRAGNLPEKKISSNHGEECVLRRTNANGIDLNRNFNVHFSDGDSMPGAVDWRGEKSMSQVESKLLAKIGASFKPDLYIDVHTGAFATLTPLSYTTQDIPKDDMSALMNLLVAVKGSKGFTFTSLPDAGQGSQLLYVAMGTTMDYFYEVLGTPYAYTWETYDQERVASLNNLMSHRSRGEMQQGVALDAASSRPSWVPDMPQMRAYKQRQQMRLGNSTGATRPLPPRAVADVAAMQPTIGGSMCSPGILPDQLCADSCFAFYNPISQPELEHYVNSWLENLVAASEYVVAHPRPHRKLR